jgi:hypothetical protein
LKSTILKALVLTMLSVNCVFAQATFVFRNYHPLGVDAPVFDAQGNRLFGDNYVALLYGGPTTDDLQVAKAGDLTTSMDPVPFLQTYNGQMGYFARPGGVAVVNVPEGGYAWLQVRAWDTRLGATYDDVAQLGIGGYGQSSLFYTYGGDVIATGRPSQPLRGLESFSLVPEPSTWTLLAMSAGILSRKCRRRTR